MLRTTLGGRYSIISRLGAGGFGETYLAEDIQLPDNHCCVVKHLKPQSTEPEILNVARRLFDSEAKVLHKLGTHDQIPRLLANFEENQEFYLVQELIEGNGLDRELNTRKKWSTAQVVDFLEDILPTLAFVHQQKVIHRDIKPENLIRRKQDGKIVLIDFGAVKQVYTQLVTEPKRAKSTITIGTMGYMPSEQANGHPQPSSDIYAVGMIAIQALTGLDPDYISKNPNTLELEWTHLAEADPRLVEIIDKMVRYDFRQRYPSANLVLAALETLNTDIASNATSNQNLLTSIELPISAQAREVTPNTQNLVTNIENITSSQTTEITPNTQNLVTNIENITSSQATEITPNTQNLVTNIETVTTPNTQNLVTTDIEISAKIPPTQILIPPNGDLEQAKAKDPKHLILKIGSAIAILVVIGGLAFNKIYQRSPPVPVANVPQIKPEDQAEILLQQVKALEQIRQKIKSGSNLQDIEALALKIPETSPIRSKIETALATYKKRWNQDQLTFNEANTALKAKNWEKALSASKKIATPYWQKEAKLIADKAKNEIAQLVPIAPKPSVVREPAPVNTYVAPPQTYEPPVISEPPPAPSSEKFSIPEAK